MTIILPALLILSHSSLIFGAAKPVPVNPYNYRNGDRSEALVSASGPLTNLAIAAFFGILFRLPVGLEHYFLQAVYINVILAVFNLIPLPPLDGSGIIYIFLSPKLKFYWRKMQRYGILVLFVLLFIFGGLFWSIIGPIINFIVSILV